MGCVSSKLLRKELQRDILCGVNGDHYVNHVVSLTSSTYGALRLDKSESPKSEKKVKEAENGESETEVINTWELMSDLEEESPVSNRSKRNPKAVNPVNGRSPFARLSKVGSPKSVNRPTTGKENRSSGQLTAKKISKRTDPPSISSSGRRKSLSPLFDPDLVEAYEKELCEEEQIKKIISLSPLRIDPFDRDLANYDEKCPPGGENRVVIYTTTLRGIRKTFEECNAVRSILDSHGVQVYERDVSMDSGFKEELRKLMGGKEGFRVPMVFVKGRLIGGADEVSKLEEEGKLGGLLEKIPKKSGSTCRGCGGIRFMMCMECNGSCRVLNEEGKEMARCGECNENGLIHCPLCC